VIRPARDQTLVNSSRREPGVAASSSRLRLWAPVGVYCALIFALSSVSNVPSLPLHVGDKLAHTALYAGFGFLVTRALAGGVGRAVTGRAVLVALAFSAVYGLSDETHQLFVPRRTFDLWDLAADVVGGGLGAAAWWMWNTLRRFGHDT
jgi:VanZ family protein